MTKIINVESEINELLEFKEYIINNKKIDEKAKKKAKEKYFQKKKRFILRDDYIIYGVGHHITNLHSFDTEELYNTLLKIPNYKLCSLKFILDSTKLIKKPYVIFFNFLPALLYGLIPVLIKFDGLLNTLSELSGLKLKEIPFIKNIYDDRFYIILGILIALPIVIYLKHFSVPRLFLQVDYIISLIDYIKENSGKDNNNLETEIIEATKITENKARKETLTIKLKNKKAPVKKITSAEND